MVSTELPADQNDSVSHFSKEPCCSFQRTILQWLSSPIFSGSTFLFIAHIASFCRNHIKNCIWSYYKSFCSLRQLYSAFCKMIFYCKYWNFLPESWQIVRSCREDFPAEIYFSFVRNSSYALSCWYIYYIIFKVFSQPQKLILRNKLRAIRSSHQSNGSSPVNLKFHLNYPLSRLFLDTTRSYKSPCSVFHLCLRLRK